MRRLLVTGVVAAACGGETVRGATVVAAGAEPAGTLVQAYRPVACRSRSGGPARYDATLYLVRVGSAEPVLVQARAGYDSIVAHDARRDGSDRVYAVVVGEVLHEVRLPPRGAGAVTVATRWDEQQLDGGGFAATPRDWVLHCALEPAPRPAPSADPAVDNAAAAGHIPGP